MPITVTTTDDEDFNGGSETDETNDGTGLSLREAFDLLNAGTSTGPITFAAPGNTFFLDNGPLNVNVDITVDGDLDDNGTADIFLINSLGQHVVDLNADNITFHNDGASIVAEGTGTGNQFNFAIRSFGDNAAFINGGNVFADSDDTGFGERGGVVQFFGDDFSITNELGATMITTGRYAVEASFSSDPNGINTTIINHGYMEATDDTIRIASGTVTNSGLIRTTGTFDFGGQRQPGDIADGLSIVGTYDPGFIPDAAGLIVFNNLAGGFVDGFRSALFMTGGGTVNNAGTLEGDVVGIFAQDDLTGIAGFNSDLIVDNMAGGRIERTGGDFGFNGSTNYGAILTGQLDSALVTNAGIIQSVDTAISAYNAITINNLVGGVIRGDSDSAGDDAIAFRGSILTDFVLAPTTGFSFFAGGESIFSTQGYTISPTGQLETPAGDFDFPGGQAETAFLGRFPDPILALVDLAATQTAGFVVYQTDGGATLFPDSFSLNYPDIGTINITGFNTLNFEAKLPNGDTVYDIPAGVDFNDIITNDGTMIGDVMTGIGDDMVTNNNEINGIVDLGLGNDVFDGALSTEEQTILGGEGNDTLIGGSSNDDISGGAGSDFIDGGNGIDLLNYSTSASRVVVNLNTGTANGGDAQGDAIANVENILGSNFDDILIGNAVSNFLIGGDGNDTLNGLAGDDILAGGNGVDILRGGGGNDSLEGGAGADIVDGTAGRDEASYDASTSRVVINLLNGTAAGGHAQGDTLLNIDDLVGSAFNDVFNGNNSVNTLIGGDGNDTLFGRGGRDDLFGEGGNDTLVGGGAFDRLDGGAGNDVLTGGSTRDVFIFADDFDQDRITDFNNGLDKIDFSAHSDFNSFTDISANASQVGADVVIMLDAANQLTLDNFNLADLDATDFIF